MSDFLDHLIAQALPTVTPPLAPRTPSRFEPVDFERLDAGADAGQAPPARVETALPAPPAPARGTDPPTASEAATVLQRPAAPKPIAARAPSHTRPPERAAAPASEAALPGPPSTRRARIPSSIPDAPFAEPPSPHRHRDTEMADVPKPPEGPSPSPAAPVESVRERVTVEVVPRDAVPVVTRSAPPPPQPQAAAVRPSLPPAVAAPAAPLPPPPTIEVRIGRIEIVAPSAPLPAEAPRPAQPAGDSRLERYLARG